MRTFFERAAPPLCGACLTLSSDIAARRITVVLRYAFLVALLFGLGASASVAGAMVKFRVRGGEHQAAFLV